MSLTLTTSQQAAARNPTAEPRTLLELESTEGLYRLSTEPLSWSGNLYVGRMTDPGEISGSLGAAANVLSAPKTFSVTLAQPDGFFSQRRPSVFRRQVATVKEVFLDVESDAVRTQAFIVAGGEMPDEGSYRFTGEDMLAPYRRVMIPRNECIITRSMYPQIPDNSPALGRTIPVLFGRAYCPCYLVDQTSLDIFVACVGSATLPTSAKFVELWDGGFSPVTGDKANLSDVFSLYYANRYGMPVTEIAVASGVPIEGPGGVTPHFIDLVMPQGSSETTPDRVFVELLRNHEYGACIDPTYIDSDALLTANQYYRANSIYFDCALTDQQPLEDWLGAWQHDAMAYVIQRDKLVLQVQNSRAPVSSFTVQNVINGTLTLQDVPLASEEGNRRVEFRDRTRDPGSEYSAQAVDPLTGEAHFISFQQYQAGSGSQITIQSPFIGRPSIAYRVAQFWAKMAYYAQRTYGLNTTVKQIALEEGDLVTHTHSLVGTSAQLCQMTEIRRRAGLYTCGLRETSTQVYTLEGGIPADPDFRTSFERVYYNGGPVQIMNGGNISIIISSHHLNGTPLQMNTICTPPGLIRGELIQAFGGALTNDVQFTARVSTDASTWIRLDEHLIAFDLSLFKSGA